MTSRRSYNIEYTSGCKTSPAAWMKKIICHMYVLGHFKTAGLWAQSKPVKSCLATEQCTVLYWPLKQESKLQHAAGQFQLDMEEVVTLG